MKIAILGIQNLKHMTTVSVYTDILEKNHIDYDLIYMDKYGIEEKNNARKAFRFETNAQNLKTPFGKLYEAFRFKKYAINIIEKEKYDFLIIWREYAVFLFAGYVYRKFKNKYTVNIRDLWNEKNFVITHYVKKAIKHSLMNTVCSDGFIPHLPEAEYSFLHCINYEAIKKISNERSEKKKDGPIVISYIGTLRFADYCCKVTDVFGNDERFLIKFIGQGSEVIQEYANSKKYNNVVCVGAFPPEETAKQLEGTDILNCAYGAKSKAESALLPTRFYYAVYMGIPILDSFGTWLQKKAEDIKIGITLPSNLDNTKSIADEVYQKYISMDFNEIYEECSKYKKEIEKTTSEFEESLLRIVRE